MNKKQIAGGVLAGLILTAGAAGTVWAQTANEATALTEDQAIEIALAEVPGTVQDTELEREDGVMVFEIEILATDGTEMEVEIDANTGTIIEVEAEEEDHDDDDDDNDDESADKDA